MVEILFLSHGRLVSAEYSRSTSLQCCRIKKIIVYCQVGAWADAR